MAGTYGRPYDVFGYVDHGTAGRQKDTPPIGGAVAVPHRAAKARVPGAANTPLGGLPGDGCAVIVAGRPGDTDPLASGTRWTARPSDRWHILNTKAVKPSAGLAVSTRDEDGCAVLTVTGEIDLYSATVLRDAIYQLIARGRVRLVVDLTEVDFCDSTGLGVFVGGFKRTRACGGTFRLVCVSSHLLGMLRITGLAKVFPVYGDVTAAVEADNADEEATG